MEYLLNSEEMRSCDRRTEEIFGVPSIVLMERAALSCVEALLDVANGFDTGRVLVLCGSGNNGGDGFAIARILKERGAGTEILFVGKEEKLTKNARIQKTICEHYGIVFRRNPSLTEYTCIVDALFGVGLSREITGEYREWIEKVNRSGKKVLAVDIPSGVSADTGKILGTAVRADLTVTFAFRKVGQVLYPGADFCSRVLVRQIGITPRSLEKEPSIQALTEEILTRLPKRKADSNKGTYGKILVAAGSKNMCGAAFLAGKAAYHTGSGLVRVLTEECNRICMQTLLPEAVLDTLETGEQEEAVHVTEKDLESADRAIRWASSICIGPGFGTRPWKKELLDAMLQEAGVPLVIDADGLNLIAEEERLGADPFGKIQAPCVVTPHPGEMARLCGISIGKVLEDPIELCKSFAATHHVVCVLKGARTVISDGEKVWINETGNDGMASGGSGDILAGMIAGWLGQGCAPLDAALLGVYLHGKAGDAARNRKSVRTMLAGDLLEAMQEVL